MTLQTLYRLNIGAALLAAFGTGYCLGIDGRSSSPPPPVPAAPAPAPPLYSDTCQPGKPDCAWVNTRTHLIYLRASRWYGVTPGTGSRYMTLSAAQRLGYRYAPDGREWQ